MKFKTTNLSPEDKKKLLELIANEERKLDEQDLSEEDLLREEQAVSDRVMNVVGTENKQQHEDIIPSLQQQDQNWEKIKARLGVEKPTENVVQISTWKANRTQWNVLLAAAAMIGLFIYLGNHQSSPTDINSGEGTYKGAGESVQSINCDYSPIGIETGSLSGDGISFTLDNPDKIRIKMDCSQTVLVHVRTKIGHLVQEFRNGQISNGYLKFDGKPLELEVENSLHLSLLVTEGKLAPYISLPEPTEEPDRDLDGIKILWQDATNIEVAKGSQ